MGLTTWLPAAPPIKTSRKISLPKHTSRRTPRFGVWRCTTHVSLCIITNPWAAAIRSGCLSCCPVPSARNYDVLFIISIMITTLHTGLCHIHGESPCTQNGYRSAMTPVHDGYPSLRTCTTRYSICERQRELEYSGLTHCVSINQILKRRAIRLLIWDKCSAMQRSSRMVRYHATQASYRSYE